MFWDKSCALVCSIALLGVVIPSGNRSGEGAAVDSQACQEPSGDPQAADEEASPSERELQRRIENALNPKESPEIDDLEAQIAAAAAAEATLVVKLQAVSLDEDRTAIDRRAAIMLLGRVGTSDAVAFLVENLDLEIVPPNARLSADTWGEEFPCYGALASLEGHGMSSVLEGLKEECSEVSVVLSALLIRRGLGEEAGEVFIKDRLRSAETDLHRDNLERLLKYIRRS
jgi:hypothetical protein